MCTYAATGGVWTRINGAIRKATGIGTSWSTGTNNGCYVYFPPGGNLYFRRLTLQNGGSGCYSTVIGESVWVSFTGYNQYYNYGGLGWGQCFRMQAMAANYNSDYTNHYGRLDY